MRHVMFLSFYLCTQMGGCVTNTCDDGDGNAKPDECGSDQYCTAGTSGFVCVNKSDASKALEAGESWQVGATYEGGSGTPVPGTGATNLKVKANIGVKVGPVNVGVEVERVQPQ